MRIITKLILLAVIATMAMAVPVMAAQQEASNLLEMELEVTYPIQLSWALGTADGPVANYTDENLEASWGTGLPKYLWFKSELSTNMSSLYLFFGAPEDAISITPVGFSANVTYDSSAGAYVAGPDGGFTFNDTAELCFQIIPLGRGFYTLTAQWNEEV